MRRPFGPESRQNLAVGSVIQDHLAYQQQCSNPVRLPVVAEALERRPDHQLRHRPTKVVQDAARLERPHDLRDVSAPRLHELQDNLVNTLGTQSAVSFPEASYPLNLDFRSLLGPPVNPHASNRCPYQPLAVFIGCGRRRPQGLQIRGPSHQLLRVRAIEGRIPFSPRLLRLGLGFFVPLESRTNRQRPVADLRAG
jgi:hypothetical protein